MEVVVLPSVMCAEAPKIRTTDSLNRVLQACLALADRSSGAGSGHLA